MKKEYMKPEQRVVQLQYSIHLLQASKVNNNVGLDDTITGGVEPVRAPQFDGPEWDEPLGE